MKMIQVDSRSLKFSSQLKQTQVEPNLSAGSRYIITQLTGSDGGINASLTAGGGV